MADLVAQGNEAGHQVGALAPQGAGPMACLVVEPVNVGHLTEQAAVVGSLAVMWRAAT